MRRCRWEALNVEGRWLRCSVRTVDVRSHESKPEEEHQIGLYKFTTRSLRELSYKDPRSVRLHP